MDSTEPSRTITPSTTSERAPMKQLSSMMVGLACRGSSTPPMPDAAGDVAVLADLGAGADRGPGVDHGAFVDIGADVHERRHQHDVLADIGAAADDRARHGAEAGGLELRGVPAVELVGDLVPPRTHRAAQRAASCSLGFRRNDSSTAFFSHWWVLQAPSIFSETRSLPASSSSRSRDGGAHRAGGGGRDAVAGFPGGFDLGLQVGEGDGGHVRSSLARRAQEPGRSCVR
jgi:hypothetical protein